MRNTRFYNLAMERYALVRKIDNLVGNYLKIERVPSEINPNIAALGEINARSSQMGMLEIAVYGILKVPFVEPTLDRVSRKFKK